MKREKRIETIKGVLYQLHDARPGVVIFGCAVHKNSFPRQDPVKLAFEDLSSRFNMFLEHHSDSSEKSRGIIVIDKSSYELGLQNLTVEIRRNGNRWGSQLRSLCEVPLFVDSKASRIIQLADHIAYALFRRYSQDDINYYNCIEDRFDQYEGVIQGLVHKQHYTNSCTCPACLTRKSN